ncbi:hypothetical protein AB0878_06335 [Amycolatopsis sp. NPDC047767]|uniref:hypothetical protein n=1 Tax=Amycolatopsis sp. NPDC047767 TaxID=3156765 RepID=UPI003454C797
MTDKTNTIPVWEPQPGVPAAALPPFGVVYAKARRTAAIQVAIGSVITAAGLALLFAGANAPASIFVAFLGCRILLSWVPAVVSGIGTKPGPAAMFELVLVDPDGLVARRGRVGVRLPDGRWLNTRLPAGVRLQLAGQRRLWLLRCGDRVSVVVPGIVLVWKGRLAAAPVRGAKQVPVIPRDVVPPSEDRVLNTDRRAKVPTMLIVVLLNVISVGLAMWAVVGLKADVVARTVDVDFAAATAAVIAVLGLLTALHTLVGVVTLWKLLRPRSESSWTELPVLDRQITFSGSFRAVLKGHVRLPDGSVAGFRTSKVFASLALDVAASDRLWTLGAARLGVVTIGVPGYPVIGVARFRPAPDRAPAEPAAQPAGQ